MKSLSLKARRAMTIHGKVHFMREVFQCPARDCRKSFAPQDVELGLAPGENLDQTVTRNAARLGAMMSFSDGSEIFEHLTAASVSAAEIQRTVNKIGPLADQMQRQREALLLAPVSPWRDSPKPRRQAERLMIQADATCVLTVAGEEHKSVYCATAFDPKERVDKGQRPLLAERAYTASAYNLEDFGPRLKALAWESGMRQATATAFMADGDRNLWRWAQANMPRGTLFIQDFWHVAEHLAELARDLTGEDWRALFERWRSQLHKGKVRTIIKDLRARRAKARGRKRERIDQELTYLEAGKHRMAYARYRRQGWPIGSGAVEGTCKHLVKDRFGLTGAQWRRANIPNVLALRLALFNQQWDELWTRRAA